MSFSPAGRSVPPFERVKRRPVGPQRPSERTFDYFAVLKAFQMSAASAAPTSGAAMNTQTWEIAVGSIPAIMSAGPKLRAGLTDVPVNGIPMICTKVSVSPMIMPA